MTLPADHEDRIQRALLSLDGLSIGDAFGARLYDPSRADFLHRPRPLPLSPWRYTDDAIMGMGIVEVLGQHGRINQDDLVETFARRYWADPDRGYGPTPKAIFEAMRRGVPWREAVLTAADKPRSWVDRFEVWIGLKNPPVDRGRGSAGNGAAMRVAPLGGYFADDVPSIIAEARASAEVTHAHPDGISGAIAVALAAGWAWQYRLGVSEHGANGMLGHVIDRTPDGAVRDRLIHAQQLSTDTSADAAGKTLGTGQPILAVETVPFCIWCAARHLGDFEEAIWTAASVGGDVDTICAIVGGIVALGVGREGVPAEWLASRESLN